MKTQKNKNRSTIVLIFAMSFLPLAAAWYLSVHPDSLKLGTSNGRLVTPPVTTEIGEFSGYDAFTAQNLKELQGHWVLLNPVGNSGCDAQCADALYKVRQIDLMMGKDISRIRRAAILTGNVGGPAFSADWQADGRLLKLEGNPGLQAGIAGILNGGPVNGSLLIMDPLGNLMMHYPPGFDPYKVRNDLNKLLKISQIG